MVKFRNKPVQIDAMNNDGTDASARALAEWILNSGGVAELYPRGSTAQNPDTAYVVMYDGDEQIVLGPTHWIYQYSARGVFFTCTTEEFNAMWELSFSLHDLIGEQTYDAIDFRKRRDGQADPIDGVGRHGSAGSTGEREGGKQPRDGVPTTDQLSAIFEAREPV